MGSVANGVMAAIIGPDADTIQSILASYKLSGIYVANYNSPDQTVISDLKADIERAHQVFAAQGIRSVQIKTSGAFHSPYMLPVRSEFERYLDTFSFSAPTIPVMCNAHARLYQSGEIATRLAEQITAPVRWSELLGCSNDIYLTLTG